MTKRLELLTPAKINLFLRITGRRPDGYHELDSIFLPITRFDRVVIEADVAAASGAVSLRCNWPQIPLDDTNLAVRAAKLFMEVRGLRWRVAIDLHKEIPAGAGLGGGSSDAGAVLRLMAQLGGIDPAALAGIALRLGADVPFFLDPQPARVRGIGEKIASLHCDCRLHLTVGVPPFAVPTAEIYRHLERSQWSGPGPAALPAVLDASSVEGGLLVNDLEKVAIGRYPEVGKIKVLLDSLGAMGTAMSGSGGAVFGLFAEAAQAQAAAQAASARMPEARFFAADVVHPG